MNDELRAWTKTTPTGRLRGLTRPGGRPMTLLNEAGVEDLLTDPDLARMTRPEADAFVATELRVMASLHYRCAGLSAEEASRRAGAVVSAAMGDGRTDREEWIKEKFRRASEKYGRAEMHRKFYGGVSDDDEMED